MNVLFGAGKMAKLVKHLPSKCDTLMLILRTQVEMLGAFVVLVLGKERQRDSFEPAIVA